MSKSDPLSVTHPTIASEANGWDPSKVTKGSEAKKEWKCTKGHIFFASPNSRTGHNKVNGPIGKNVTGCPNCKNQKVLIGYNDLLSTNPDLASEADGWDPTAVVAGSPKRVDWICQAGHKWTASISSRSRLGTGCPFCSNVRVLPGFNDLSTLFPEIANQACGWNPSLISPGTKKRLLWQCSKGHSWQTSVYLRTKRNFGCPFCSQQKLLVGFNDLETSHPDIAAEAFGWDPKTVTSGSVRKVKWRCPRGHNYEAIVRDRAQRNTSCVFCSGKKVLVGFNDLKTTYPYLAQEAYLWDPETVSQGSNLKRRWKCGNGHIWSAVVANRTGRGDGCPACARTGYDPSKDGWLYFIVHPDWKMYQIGITNSLKDRLTYHLKNGWMLLDSRGPLEGYLAREWEVSILKYVKSNGGKMANNLDIKPFDGYTEAWLQASFNFSSLKEIMDIIDEQEIKGFH
jgi:hypothetical protein